MGIVVVADFAANMGCRASDVTKTSTVAANQFGRQRRQSIDLILGPAVDDRHVLALDVPDFFEALAKCAQPGASSLRAFAVIEKPITGIASAARAATGHVTTAPPRSAKKFPPLHAPPPGRSTAS